MTTFSDIFGLVEWLGSGRYPMGIGVIVTAGILAFMVSPWLALAAAPGVLLILWKFNEDRSQAHIDPADRVRKEFD